MKIIELNALLLLFFLVSEFSIKGQTHRKKRHFVYGTLPLNVLNTIHLPKKKQILNVINDSQSGGDVFNGLIKNNKQTKKDMYNGT